jgi:hypothetical protein
VSNPQQSQERPVSTFKSMITAAAILVATSTLVWAQSRMRPGQYELVTEMNIAGTAKPALKATDCITAEVLKDQTKLLMQAADEQNCKVSDLVKAGDRTTFNFACNDDGVRSVSRVEMNYGVDSASGVVTTKVEGEVTTTRLSWRRIGECKR